VRLRDWPLHAADLVLVEPYPYATGWEIPPHIFSRVRFPGDFAGDVEHWHHDVYRMTGRGPEGWQLFMTFVINEAGHVAQFRMRELVFQRLPGQSE
jgi:hypothetical protein